MIKKMIKGEKGFTLVELLAVIVILGIVVAIAIPAIGSVIDNARGDAEDAKITMIVDAARLYEVQEGALPEAGVSVGTLISEGYLDERQGKFSDADKAKVVKRVGVTTDSPGELEFDPD
ncbi:competence type IV pilus major pilin ComGC [Amphibacillus indicireducens]|uniref:Prepilin-type N-terminal cleavage/methylation domain-containing protein n=1 Tax=Amphibacillus indicireducens TaxID=1076330 RepID=A0ABP7VFS2_9BACI